MIFHDQKTCFIHVPKCGGTSVELCLLKNFYPDFYKKLLFNLDKKKRFPLSGFLNESEQNLLFNGRLKDGCQHYPISFLDQKTQENYFIFTFVRNPWSKALSEYFYFKNQLKFKIAFKKFINRNCPYPFHMDKQISFINENIDFIGRFENFQEDFDTVCDKIGIARQKLPHKNKTNHKHYTEYYDDETREIVAKKYAKDIEYFGYEFGD